MPLQVWVVLAVWHSQPCRYRLCTRCPARDSYVSARASMQCSGKPAQGKHLGVGLHLNERNVVDEGGDAQGNQAGSNRQHEQEAGLVRLQKGHIQGGVDAGAQAQQGFQNANDGPPAAFDCSS